MAQKTPLQQLDIQKQEITAVDLARVLGFNRSRVTQLETSGIIHRNQNAKYLLCESVYNYISSIKKKKSVGADADYEKARARKMEAQADLQEMAVKKKRGELVEIQSVVDTVKSEYATTRQKIFAIPNKLARDIVHCESAKQAQGMMLEAINEALSGLEYDEDKIIKDVENTIDDPEDFED